MRRSYDVAVLGGGPAGLMAAWRAAQAGFEVAVFERSDAVGGMAASFDVGGVRVDHGSHRLHPSIEPRILAELQRLLGEELQLRPRRGRIRLEGRWVAFPLRASDLVRRLPPSFALGAARDTLAPAHRARADTFDEVARERLGRTVAERFYFPYARKIWGCEPEALSGEQARRRISAGSSGALVRRLLRRRTGAGQSFWYPARGFGRIVEVLAAAALDAGVQIRTAAAVTGLALGDDGAEVAVDGDRVACATAWSTMPLPALARLTTPTPPPPVLDAVDRLPLRALVLVYLVLARRQWTAFDAHYLPGTETIASRVSEPRNYRNGDDPHDMTVLCAEVPCWAGDEIWNTPATALAERLVGELARLDLPSPDPVAVETRRLAAAYPVYRVGYEEAFAALDGWAMSHDRLLSFGRLGLHAHDNTHHALAMGWAAADALHADGIDRDRWGRSRADFAAHVVED